MTATVVITLATLPEVTARGDHGLVELSLSLCLSLYLSLSRSRCCSLSGSSKGARTRCLWSVLVQGLNRVGACRLDGAGC